MSDHIPFEIQVQIIKRLPLKSLLQFRSVSKLWKSLIDSSEFIAGYTVRQTQPKRLLVWYHDVDSNEKYVSLVDEQTFTQQEFAPTVPELAKLLDKSRVVGSSQGLFCLYDDHQSHPRHTSGTIAVIWNPSIKKSVGVALPGVFGLETILGFGVCPITSDPTIVKINMWWGTGDETSVQVFTLSARSWKTLSGTLPNKSITITWRQVCIDRFIYWFAYERVSMDGKLHFLITSFDLTTHEFKAVDLPDSLSGQFSGNLSISKVSESLVVLERSIITNKLVCVVWIIDHGVPNSFRKLFNINPPDGFMRTLGFTKNGEPVILKQYDHEDEQGVSLAVYLPRSEGIKDIGICGDYDLIFVGSYMETLLLINESDCGVYDKNGVSIYPNVTMDQRLEMNGLPKEENWSAPTHRGLDPLPNSSRPRRFSICSSLRKLCNTR